MAVIDVVVESEEWDSHPELGARVEEAVAAALAGAGVNTLPNAEIAVLLTDDEGITVLNERWRGKATPTNVLSWPATLPKLISVSPMIGDIAIAYETTRREAEAEGKSLNDHVAHLVVHGTLHLLGFDHESHTDAEAMEGLERTILRGLQIADPYGASTDMKDGIA